MSVVRCNDEEKCVGPCRCGREACYQRPASLASYAVYTARQAMRAARRLDREARESPHRSDYPSYAKVRRRTARSLLDYARYLCAGGESDRYVYGTDEDRQAAMKVVIEGRD